MKRWLSLAAAVVALMATPAIGAASQDSVHYGPFESGSGDSGTCGPDWANDTFKRVFDASTSPSLDNTYSVTETFISCRFETIAGPSPDACDPSGTAGSTIVGGVTGSFNGSFQVIVAGGTFNADARCDWSTCNTTTEFVKTVYGPAATFTTGPSFSFTYHANGPDLVQREWQNASPDQGGNSGDIRST
jgi:hypothetical protein